MWQKPETAPKNGIPLIWALEDGSGVECYLWVDGNWWKMTCDPYNDVWCPQGPDAPGALWTYFPIEVASHAGRWVKDQIDFIHALKRDYQLEHVKVVREEFFS